MKNASSERNSHAKTLGDDLRFQQTTLAMAYVPWQAFEINYPSEMALQRGTLFTTLDKPFCSTREVYCNE